ncbi:competence type IV pilus ATPase ComGA [Oceanobacillus manasiensis]|uniref:competence type IV pilus ATPase ComGA n=1 Tax=Oceanobacillus manasiensis TaxID=586413 RepID=UPI0005A96A3A|nr:competence type IV pilus ATPase ComGA [Oceanobacillus manasiensis]
MNYTAPLSEKLFNEAFRQLATDIHFSPYESGTDIYFRIQGKRVFYTSLPPSTYRSLLSYYKFASGMDIGEIRKPQNGTLTHQTKDKLISLRLSTLPVKEHESLAIRLLSEKNQLTLDQLFIFPYQLKKLKQWVANRAGIILFTGPTGSGKTTTLYALLQAILNEKSYQTITLEDPIERKMDNMLQVQVNEKAGVTYQAGLKAALRHDPDIIMVGEIRDDFTAKFAFDASLTGHLVFSTLHAKNTTGTIHRLLEMGLKQNDLEQSLLAVASLELLPLQINETTMRRGAIMELLEGEQLEISIRKRSRNMLAQLHSFEHLRKKAFAYGYISETVYKELQARP